jgi:uncharacterized membrane protein YphA (DoxX/SURF4 family)
MKKLLTISRWLVGLLFIFSGLIKANDPLGLSYKMQEFFEVWGTMYLNDYSLFLSVVMISFEIIAGVAVIIGWQFELFSWLLLLLIVFFTFLTGFAYLSGTIRACGCFGDCIKLTSKDSFIKDIFLTVFIVFLFIKIKTIRVNIKQMFAIIILSSTVLFSIGVQVYVLNNLPIVDCLPYKIGKNILEQRKIPQGAIPDSTVINFVYLKNGNTIEFDADHFPADFDDSIYQFVKRYDKVVRKGNAEPPIKDFVLITANNADTTEAVLSSPGKLLIIFSKDWKTGWNPSAEKMIQFVKLHQDYKLIIATAALDKVDLKSNCVVLKSDFVAIKTAARVDPTLYYLNDGIILNKWAIGNWSNAIQQLK